VEILDPNLVAALVTRTALGEVLGVDNGIILASKPPPRHVSRSLAGLA
jgi:predicted tellurium resistance membrane protein TerC